MGETTDRPEKRATTRLLDYAAVAVTAAVPLISLPGLASPFSTPKIAFLAICVLAGAGVLLSRGLALFRFESTLQQLALAWMVLVSGTALWGDIVSLKALLIALLPPACFLLLTWLKPTPASLASALVSSGAAIGCIAIAQYLGLDPFRLIGWQAPASGSVRLNVYATLGNPNFVAAFLACVLPLSWVLDGSRKRNRVLSGLAALLMIVGIVVTGSRAPIIGGICLVLCAGWLFPSISIRQRVMGLVILVLFAVLAAGLSGARPIRETLEGRLFIWQVAIGRASARTLALGDGPGAFAARYPKWETEWAASKPRDQARMRFLGYQEHAHNDWLEILVEQGIIGVVLLALILLGVWRMLRTRTPPLSPLVMGGVAAVAVFVGIACVDFPFHRPAESFVFWTLLAIVHLSFSTGEGSDE